MKVKDILALGTCKIVGRGDKINIWTDPWVPDCEGFRPIPLIEPGLEAAWVQDFIMPGTVWNVPKLRRVFLHRMLKRFCRYHFRCQACMMSGNGWWIEKGGSQ